MSYGTPLNITPDAWPTVGQAAIGIEYGFLTDSPDKALHPIENALRVSSPNETQSSIASMTKIVTAMAIEKEQPLEPGQPGQSYSLTAEDVDTSRAYEARGGAVLPIHEGMVLTQHDALRTMLIGSANGIADMLVKRVFNSVQEYTSYAKDMLSGMGLGRTVIADATGFNPDTISTPSELVTIGFEALKNPVLAGIVAEREAQIPGLGTINTRNQMLRDRDEGVIGIKTGTTKAAGSCVLGAARHTSENGQEATVVWTVMGARNATNLYGTSRNLLALTRSGLSG